MELKAKNNTKKLPLLSKNQSAFIRSLQQKKFRDEHNCFVAEGAKLVQDLVNADMQFRQIYSSTNFQLSLFNHHIEIIRITEREMARISSLSTPSDVLAVCEIPDHALSPEQLAGKLSLVLDDIRDPGNLGTIMRIADWFGIEHVICSKETVDLYNPKVVQATMGSIARVRLHYKNLAEFIPSLPKTLECFGAFLDGENIYTAELPASGLIVIGNEGKGISESIAGLITRKISIPSFAHLKAEKSEAESLNAAVAASIICSEFRRRT